MGRMPTNLATTSVVRVRQYALQSSEESVGLGFLDLLAASKVRLDCLVSIEDGSRVPVVDLKLPLLCQAGNMHDDLDVFTHGKGAIVKARGIAAALQVNLETL